MKFRLEGLTVYFPYEYIYPEQYNYMLELKRGLDAKGHCLLEMPTGTGKTITLLSLITSYQLAHPEMGKLVYCTRTVHEMEKVLAELRLLQAYQEKELGNQAKILALGLSSRKNLCIHPRVSGEGSRESVDAGCRKLTASWVRERAMQMTEGGGGGGGGGEEVGDIELCSFFEGYQKSGGDALLPPGVYTLHELKQFGKQKGWCPYFLARHMITFANVVVYNYSYVLDPKVAGIISRQMEKECVVVFDEAHNIDNVCIEALSVNIRQQTLEGAQRNLSKLLQIVDKFKATDAARLRQEYTRLVEGMAQRGNLPIADHWLANPAVPDDILREAVPGNIRRAEHFIAFLRRLVQHLRTCLEITHVKSEGPYSFLHDLNNKVGIDQKPLRFCYDRLQSLLLTLEVTDMDEFTPLHIVCDFATLVGTYTRGFAIITEPYDERMPHIPDPVLQLSCLDSSLAIKPVFERFQSVVITSGTLSPINEYMRLLNFHPVVIQSFPMSLTRECLCPMVLTRGSDQLPVSTKFDMRSDPGVVRNYGRLLVEMVSVVPDGVVCFFVSYSYMDGIVNTWNEMGILKVSEILRARLEYLRDCFQIKENEFLTFDAVRQAAQCVGRVIRSKSDYGMMIFADKRYTRHDKRSKLPGWILSQLKDAHVNLSTDMAVHIAKEFLRKMAQPFDKSSSKNSTLLSQADVESMQKMADG
ncbi:hypothetical protein CBR_g47089 [Chara braunii]|uniref:DNA 5'-3' helicase n=1 Tax=Chara braunii TaxID=69332 RepID=A0A388M1E2_CHABU|nr:hypothetical protein CBR_g47089 [Chara braunii]|eukprot:GBG88390.1 hypothetical protein CBR_g47089 [Chara braunii]